MHRWLVPFCLVSLTFACSGTNDSGLPANGGSGGNIGQQGCTAEPDCNACDGCYSLCVCTTGDVNLCKPACGIAGSGGSSGGSGGSGATGGGGSGGSGGSVATGDLAAGLRITEVSVYQAVKIPIMQQGAAVTNTNAPVVVGRDALIRVFVAPDPGFQPREIVGRLELAGAPPIEVKKMVSAATVESDLQSAFNFEVPGAQMTPNVAYSVSLLEAAPGAPAGATDGARVPAQGTAPTGAQNVGPIQMVIVPLVSNGYTPDTSPDKMELLRKRMKSMYPVPDVVFTMHGPVNTAGVSGNGAGFDQALDTIASLRQQENAPFNAHYYGLLAPAPSAQQFCGYGCVAGLSFSQSQPSQAWARSSVGIAYFPNGSSLDAPDTMAHEVGHANGLPHAPCQTQDAGSFPYSGGAIGVWGYDSTVKTLLSPTSYKDVMGYCDPDWISDFNYKRIATRLQTVNGQAYIQAPSDPAHAPGRFRSATTGVDGKLRWGSVLEVDTPMTGEIKEVALLDAAGQKIGSVVGFFHPFDHIDGGMLLVRESSFVEQPGVAALAPAGLGSVLEL